MAGSEWFGAQERHDLTAGQHMAAADEGSTSIDISEATATGTTVADTMDTDGEHEAVEAALEAESEPQRKKRRRPRGKQTRSTHSKQGKLSHNRRH